MAFPSRSSRGTAAASGRQITEAGRAVLNRGIIAETGVIPAGLQYMRDSYIFRMIKPPTTVVMEGLDGRQIPVMRVSGLFQESDIQNANGRVYPRDVLANATKIIQEDMSRRAVFGELDHPLDAKIHMDRISHLVTKGWMDGTKVYGEAEVLDNQFHGAALRGLFERKCQVGISSRGVGDMEMRESSGGKQTYVVLPGYQYVTWDAVAEPSVSGAILNVVESLNRKVKPIQEAREQAARKAASQKRLLDHSEYEELLVEAAHDFFSIKPILPAAKRKHKAFSFGK